MHVNKKDIVLIGGGGHCLSCIDVIESSGEFNIVGIVDTKERIGQSILGYPIIGCDDDLELLVKKYKNFCISIGQIKSPNIRIKKFQELKDLGAELPVIISSTAIVSKHCSIEEGTIVMHGAVLQAGSEVGVNCIINDKALVEHGVKIDSFSHISTGAIVNGDSSIGKGSFIGSGAVVIQAVKVGERVVIGSGEIVKKDVAAGETLK